MKKIYHPAHLEDFLILGPALVRGKHLLEAIHALYFLPENFKLIFTAGMPEDQALRSEVTSLLERNALGHRVHFSHPAFTHHAVVLRRRSARHRNGVTGTTAEALASAILNLAHGRTGTDPA